MTGTPRVALFALVLAVPGCKKDSGDRGEATTAEKAAAPESPAEPAAPAPTPAAEPGATAPSPEEQATAEKAAAVMEELGTIAESARGNCDKAAAAMKATIEKNKPVLTAAARLGEDDGKEQWLEDKYGPRMDAAKSKLMPLMEKCAEHEGVATVFDSIE